MQNNLKIIIPVYNAELWIEKCLQSLITQHYTNWEAIVIDDLSTDNTYNKIAQIKHKNIQVKQNTQRKLALENIVDGINILCKSDEDVIIILDGDDWLAHTAVFDKINTEYQTENIWLTYGTYQIYPSNKITDRIRELQHGENPRTCPMIFRHLRTFKYFLWKNVTKQDLTCKETNSYYPTSYDSAMMRPMAELAGKQHIKYIPDILYIYNFANPIGDGRIHRAQQRAYGKEITEKPPHKQKTKEELIRCR